MCKENERLNYMAEAHIISGGNYFDDSVEFQEKEDDKVVFCVWRDIICRVIFSCKLNVRFSCSFSNDFYTIYPFFFGEGGRK
jgi:hypothetical protein